MVAAAALAALSLQAGAAEVVLAADPPQLRLGTDAMAELVITAPGDTAELEVTTSLGRIEALSRGPDGRYRARFLPPAQSFPQVAILAGVARSASGEISHGWGRIPLWGQGDAVVRARPGQQIVVRIGDREYGPVVANAAGVAQVPVVVPPGVTLAYHGNRPIELGVPPARRLHLVQAGGPGEGGARVLLVFAVSPDGAPREGAPPSLAATAGTVGPLERLEAGVHRALWTPPPAAVGAAKITAEAPGEPHRAELTFDLSAAQAARLRILAGLKVGAVSNLREVSTPQLAVEAQLLPQGPGPLALTLELSRFAFGPDPSARSPLFPEAPLGGLHQYHGLMAGALYRHPLDPNWQLEVGARLGLGWVRSRLWTPDQPLLVEQRLVPAGHLAAGVHRSLGPGGVTLELRASLHADPGLRILAGQLLAAELLLGYRLELR